MRQCHQRYRSKREKGKIAPSDSAGSERLVFSFHHETLLKLPRAANEGRCEGSLSLDRSSRRNHTSPKKKADIAAMNSNATGMVASKRKKALRNKIAITVHTRSAVTVQKVMARLMSFARREGSRDRRVASRRFPPKYDSAFLPTGERGR